MTVEERLAAVERALTDDDTEPAALSDAATVERRLDALEERLDAFERRLADAEAGVEAVRGHVGHEQSAIEDVERTAATALATARRVEQRRETGDDRGGPRPQEQPSLREPTVDRGSEDDTASADASDTTRNGPRHWLDGLFES